MSKLFKGRIMEVTREMKDKAKRMNERTKLLRHPAVLAAWNLFPIKQRKAVTLFMSDFYPIVYMSLTVDNLEGFKDERLLKMLEPFTTDAWQADTSDWTGGEQPNREFRFNQRLRDAGQNFLTLTVCINAYVKSDSPACRIVEKKHDEVVTKVERFIVCA